MYQAETLQPDRGLQMYYPFTLFLVQQLQLIPKFFNTRHGATLLCYFLNLISLESHDTWISQLAVSANVKAR